MAGVEDELTNRKLRALAELAAGAGHEINNPVATISGYVQQLLGSETDPDRILALETIGAQALRIRDMIGDLMLFARPPQPKLVACDLVAAVDDVRTGLAERAADQGVDLRVGSGPTTLPIVADATQLRVLLSALVSNAVEATPPGGRVVLEVGHFVDGDAPQARFTVTDTGRGLSELDREHLFDPFYSGRQAGRGLGFGLAKAWRIATLHAATLRVATPPGGGVVCTLLWPLQGDLHDQRTQPTDRHLHPQPGAAGFSG
ncbi:MAG: sensor histidine kinase [Planctomycetaceae bacterium]